MKKVFSLLLASYFLLSSVGLNASAHYCMGNIAELAFGFAVEADGCGMEEDTECESDIDTGISPYNCCDDKQQQLLVENDFSGSVAYDFEIPNIIFVELSPIFAGRSIPTITTDYRIPPNNPPPNYPSFQILFCSYLI